MIKVTKIIETKQWTNPQGQEIDFIDVMAEFEGKEMKGSIWPSKSIEVSTIKEGDQLDLEPVEKNGYYSFKSPKAGKASNTRQMNLAMEKKQQNINQTMDRKEESIKETSAARDATLLITAMAAKYEDLPDEKLQERWLEWRKFFYERYSDDKKDITQPF